MDSMDLYPVVTFDDGNVEVTEFVDNFWLDDDMGYAYEYWRAVAEGE